MTDLSKDTLLFAAERRRMCKAFPECSDGCPLKGKACHAGRYDGNAEQDKQILSTIQQWHDEHPIKTSADELKKQILEERDLLMKLLYFIGSDIYFIPSKVNFDLNKLNGHEESNRVYHQKVSKIVFTKHGWYLECDKDLEYGTGHILVDELYKKTWFLAQAEAECALERIRMKDCPNCGARMEVQE